MTNEPQETPFDAQMRRLIERLAPGAPLDRYVGWLAGMRDDYAREPLPVVREAVDLALQTFERVPVPKDFRACVEAARRKVEASPDLAVRALPSPAQAAVLTEREVEQVTWLRAWYAGVIARRREGAYLDERMYPDDLARMREVQASEDRLGHIPDLPPERLKAALAGLASSTRRAEDEGDDQ